MFCVLRLSHLKLLLLLILELLGNGLVCTLNYVSCWDLEEILFLLLKYLPTRSEMIRVILRVRFYVCKVPCKKCPIRLDQRAAEPSGFLKPLTKAEGKLATSWHAEEHVFLAGSAVSFSLCSPAARVVLEILEGRSLSRQFSDCLLPCLLMNLSNPFAAGNVCLCSSLWYQITEVHDMLRKEMLFFPYPNLNFHQF